MEVEAWHRGFAAAPRKAFLGDGLPANWRMQRERFSHYVPVVDLMHAIAYVYTAAIESSSDMNECWQRYCRWIPAIWHGGVSGILPEIEDKANQPSHERDGEILARGRGAATTTLL